MHPLLRAAADRQGGVFSAVDARRAGYGPAEIQRLCASGRWRRLRRGIYTTPAVADGAAEQGRHLELACLAVQLDLDRPTAAISHATAVRLLGLPTRAPDAAVVRLTDPTHNRRGRGFHVTRS
ncbi:MAG: type IV toxin-antitoxin system AbiEi family antitoxin domain-containing protein, partial [Blastococcus sp.]|nr:type IV toxin-antitoxin system AbiEi family antitoxin domain-containing protein [Blastococcus sp.]